MKDYHYTIILHPDPEGGYAVSVPALPGIATQGETVEEATAMAKDAIKLYIESLIDDGEAIPVEAEPLRILVVDVAA